METSLHREFKRLYSGDGARQEVRLGNYRIDVVQGERLVEIQHGSLAAIRDKVRRLLEDHQVLVVKPIVARKLIVKHNRPNGPVVSRRTSPKRGTLIDLFDELVYFTSVFPHPRLAIEAVLVEVEECRYPGHGRRRRWRRSDHVVADQRLLDVGAALRLQTPGDLLRLLPAGLSERFDTAELARLLDKPRWIAQRIAYCLRETGAVASCGKQGNTRIYRCLPAPSDLRGKKRRA